MSFEKYLRQKQIEKEAKEAASKSVNEVVRKMMRSEFDYHTYNERECNIHNHAFYLGEQHKQSKVDELQKRVDVQTKHIEMALVAVKDINESAIDEFHNWDVINEKAPKLCEHLQNLSVAVVELEQALKGGE